MTKKTIDLIGFRVNPDCEEPELYILMICADKDYPLMVEGDIIFFTKPTLGLKAVQLSSNVDLQKIILKTMNDVDDVDFVVDIAEVLYLISDKNIDDQATIINCLNTLFDLVLCTGIPMPSNYKKLLYNFADHLTFHQEFSSFLEQHSISRSWVIDAILWCMNTVVAKSKLLRE